MNVRRILIAAVLMTTASPAFAQWFKYPTPGIPRNPDGKPNLSAPAPRTAACKTDACPGLWLTLGHLHR